MGTGAGGSVCAGSLGGLAHVAIKVMHDSDSGSWRQEVELLSRHRHPNIVTLLGCAVDEGGSVAVIFEWLSVGDVMYRLHRSLFDVIEFH